MMIKLLIVYYLILAVVFAAKAMLKNQNRIKPNKRIK